MLLLLPKVRFSKYEIFSFIKHLKNAMKVTQRKKKENQILAVFIFSVTRNLYYWVSAKVSIN